MRLPLAVSLKSRDGTLARDAKVKNALIEPTGEETATLRKRPGVQDLGLVKAGTAQLLHAWGGIKTVHGDFLNAGTISTIVSAPVQTNLSPTNAGLQFSGQESGSDAATPRLMIKNKKQAWAVDRAGAVSAITYAAPMGDNIYTAISLARVGTVATVTLSENADINVGDSVAIAGATPIAYNGAQTVTGVTLGSPARTVVVTITRSGTTATATSATPHGLSSATYTLSGATQAEYNGAKAITVTGPTTFTFVVGVTAFQTPATGSPVFVSTILGNFINFSGPPFVPLIGGAYGNLRVMLAGHGFGNGDTVTMQGYSAGTVANATAGGFDLMGTSVATPAQGTGAFEFSATVSSITGSGGLGTVTTATPHRLVSGSLGAQISGATPTDYNTGGGIVPVNITGSTTFTYAVDTTDTPHSPATGTPIVSVPVVNFTFTFTIGGAPATPATGTITAALDGGTVPGIVYLNGYFIVMDVNGVLWNSAIDDCTTWNALDFTTAQAENGKGRAIAKALNYVAAFKEWSAEFFYDRADGSVGSPLGVVETALSLIGCASGDSVAAGDGVIGWIAQVRQRGRSVYIAQGAAMRRVSTPDVERVLNADDLATVHAYWLDIEGHSVYLVTLVTSNITLAYDMTAGSWSQWSSLTLGASRVVGSIVRNGRTAIVQTETAHGLTDGAPAKIAGADQAEYNGIFQARVITATAFSIRVSGTPTSPATGTLLAYPYTESYFKFTKATTYADVSLLLHETDGHIYQMLPTLHQDAGLPVDVFARTARMDGGTLARKKMGGVALIGDKVDDIAMVRWSDDDCDTFTAYRIVELDARRPELRKCGGFERRTVEVRHIGNTPLQLAALELEISK